MQKYHIFSSIKDWKNFIKKFKLTIGNRVHGSVLSINSGVPAICCNKDARAQEMCELLKIPVYKDISSESDVLDVYDKLVDLDLMENSYLHMFKEYKLFLEANNLKLYEDNLVDFNFPDYSLVLYRNKDICDWKEHVTRKMIVQLREKLAYLGEKIIKDQSLLDQKLDLLLENNKRKFFCNVRLLSPHK